MSSAVSFSEAVEVLHWMSADPGRVTAVRGFDEGTYGPLPFIVQWRGEEAIAMISFTGGEICGLASLLIGKRHSNAHDWIGEAEGDPIDELSRLALSMLEQSLRCAAERVS